jgi:hypothetical protein
MKSRHTRFGAVGLSLIAAVMACAPVVAAEGEAASGAAGPSKSVAATSEDISQLKAQLAAQQRQIEQLSLAIERLQGGTARGAAEGMTSPQPASLGEVASTAPMVPSGRGGALQRGPEDDRPSPLSVRLGTAYLTPLGFMDFTSVIRQTNAGGGIGSNFSSIPLNNSTNGKLSETRLSMQNSRVGFRVDAKFGETNFLAYAETDFLGNQPGNLVVTSNSNTLRSRLFFADVRRGKLEIVGGQAWSLVTPNRRGLSPLTSDIFYTNDIDTNYQVGLAWSRDPQIRLMYHATDAITAGVSFENPEQYVGGSAGATLITPPTALAALVGTQLDNGATTSNVPNLHPDIVAKIAFDPMVGKKLMHVEVGGVLRTFKIYNPVLARHDTTSGGAGFFNFNLELLKGFRVIMNNYAGSGNGRYIFGQAPDLILNGRGGITLVDAASNVSGFELQAGKTLFYAYYGGVYIRRTQSIDPATGRPIGWGYAGSPSGQNRTVQEGSFGFSQALWRNDNYGSLTFMGNYSYLTRNPWFIAPGTSADAHLNMVWMDLRYTLPGKAPSLK